MFWEDDLTIDDIEENLGEWVAKEIIDDVRKGYTNGRVTDIQDRNFENIDANNINEINTAAKRIFQTTDKYYKDTRGYILTDGTILVFGDYTDHISINRVGNLTIGKFESLGGIRIGKNSFELEKEPTKEQRYQLIRLINSYSHEELYVDIVKYSGEGTYASNICGKEYIHPDYHYVLGEIDRYFSEGLKLKESKKSMKVTLKESQLRQIIKEALMEIIP